MEIVITEWALDSYLNLVGKNVISSNDYWNVIRPDVVLLKSMTDTKFSNSLFWGPAKVRGVIVQNGYKMKWHNLGNGRIQLRLCVALLNGKIYLCRAFVKSSSFDDERECANLRIFTGYISKNQHIERGML
jgi:hypothetical protein